MKKRIILISVLIVSYYLIGFLYYQYFLPYPVKEGTFNLSNTSDPFEIEYNDPDISYREFIVEITLTSGGPIEIVYIQCSDDIRITLHDGSTQFEHNMAGNVYIRLINSEAIATGTFTVIDRASLLIPKSATEACTSMPGIAFAFNYTIILFVIMLISGTIYILIYKQDQVKSLAKKIN